MKQMDKKVDIVIYPDAGHGFENPNNEDGYRADDAADAWKRTVKIPRGNVGKISNQHSASAIVLQASSANFDDQVLNAKC